MNRMQQNCQEKLSSDNSLGTGQVGVAFRTELSLVVAEPCLCNTPLTTWMAS